MSTAVHPGPAVPGVPGVSGTSGVSGGSLPGPPFPDTGPALAQRLARSAAATGSGAFLRTDEISDWFEERRNAHHFAVRRIPFADLRGWSFRPGTGNLGHDSGRFFTVEGLRVGVDGGPYRSWRQPIIHQPEVGVLGILAKEFDGVLHFLMQAKMEPGNPNLLQLSPTVQATRSNYLKVHGGADVPYLDRFLEPERTGGRVLCDALQSEHGAWFFRKSNRNMIVEVFDDIAPHDDFRWLTLGQIGELLRRENLVNMDARSVLAGAPVTHPEDLADRGAVRSDTHLLSWFAAERSAYVLAERVPLDGLDGWRRGPWHLERHDGRFFRVMAVAVEAGSREVTGWTQPLIEPVGRGVAAFVVRRFHGVPHVLVQARAEAGLCHGVELAPTVQCVPENHAQLSVADRPPFLDVVLGATPDRIAYEAVLSEEGGRFLDAESRYLIVEAPADDDRRPVPDVPPPGYQWATPAQLGSLARHGYYLNVQARTLLSVIGSGAAGPALNPRSPYGGTS
ncbi:NDP-hexose 2,3-dehydratase family protein [Streptomyces ferrugineus]|uniref:NDP-hexose 2,3-dehydratase family protein n=1 Tax=Streptomyces ferrugineus TaxID=1413221 RepID=A0A7M2SHG4_9ACTN|nr:NDP-hexose 2,3-dehydratase family protein [Streptomyces ferrugineus]QOV35732.1 NDP-hexose 2,3-dehydratase family protein [Streptomyces ferrugineus]